MDNIECLNIKSNIIINNIKIIPLKLGNLEDFNAAVPSFFSDGFIVLELHTNEGIIGLGEPSTYANSVKNLINFIDNDLRAIIIGKSITKIWSQLNLIRNTNSKISKSTKLAIVAALTQALLDIIGKENKIPIWKMLSSSSQEKQSFSQKLYASGGMYFDDEPVELFIEEALKIKNMGYEAWKFRPPIPRNMSHNQRTKNPPGIDLDKMKKIIPKIRNNVGEDFHLMIDLGCRLKDVYEAKNFLKFCNDYNFFMVEEPVIRDINLYIKISSLSLCPIAGGEILSSELKIKNWTSKNTFNIYQPDINFVGFDLLNTIKDSKNYNKKIIVHNWANAISNSANFHFAGLIGDCEYVEKSILSNPLRDDLVNEFPEIKNGKVTLSDKPGLGVTLNKNIIKKYFFEI